MARGDGLTRQLELWMLLDQLMSDGSRILTMKLTGDPFANFTHPLDEDDLVVAAALQAVTRLGGPSVTVVCLEQRGCAGRALGLGVG